ncbi:hypothetical protein BGZ61DRAFT_472179 [Ilyonectria robusta]|uniref:uncharacterized protein n=1 Tax=Ilyonectria robusta TaxID=1079257 RepID=UPI001E8CA029|nr:uncharacterized protein BGZ61DRAFT_472179 [Ilyonectria robusta]KAH8735783.1 hypothetical protein BGZ61DRAFT_472179 [Ilyonectria robusta]
MATQSEAFKTAVVDSKKLTAKPSNDQLLELYGSHSPTSPLPLPSVSILLTRTRPTALFKVGCGEDISTVTAPGAFDFKGKYKYRAWKELVDEGISAETAQERYVVLVEKLKAELGYDAEKVPETVGQD